MNNRRLMVTPVLLLLALAVGWIYSNQTAEPEVSVSKGEIALTTWLKQQGWSYFLQTTSSQCQVLVSKPEAASYMEVAEDVDRACRRLLIKIQSLSTSENSQTSE